MKKAAVGAILAVPLIALGSCTTVLVIGASSLRSAQATSCTAGASVSVAVDGLPAQVGAFKGEQLRNAAAIMAAGSGLGLDAYGQTIGVMTAIGESTLRVVDYGDAAGPDSRGLFQQRANGAWGSYTDRMNPTISATNFFKALMRVPNWRELSPTQAAHRTQRNLNPNHYTPFWQPAVQIVAALSGDPKIAAQLAQNTGEQPCGALDSAEGSAPVPNGWARPTPGRITSDFGARERPTAGASTFHKGIDFGGGCDAPIYAAAAGRVVNSGPARGYSNWIVLENGGGYRTVYGHMESQDLLVKVGQTVTAGQLISRIGDAGVSTACHLHFEVHRGDDPIDPVPFLRQVCGCID